MNGTVCVEPFSKLICMWWSLISWSLHLLQSVGNLPVTDHQLLMNPTVFIFEYCLFNSVNHEDGNIDTEKRQHKLAPTGCLRCVNKLICQLLVTGIKSCEVRKWIKALTLDKAVDIIRAVEIYTTELKNIDYRSCENTFKHSKESQNQMTSRNRYQCWDYGDLTKQCTSMSCGLKNCCKHHKNNYLLRWRRSGHNGNFLLGTV